MGIKDTNNNELVNFSTTASAVNEITVKNAATTAGPEISATGTDTNIDLKLTPKGSGKLDLDGIKFPNADGTSGQVLQTNGSGVLSFGTPSVASLSTASGSAPSYSARAWVNFNGGGTVAINEDGNVTSITDNGTGNYTVNFTTAMSDANYSTCATTGPTVATSNYAIASYANGGTYSTTAVQITTLFQTGGAPQPRDYSIVSVSVFR